MQCRDPRLVTGHRSDGLAEDPQAGVHLVRDVRGKGLMLGIEFDTPEHAEEVQWACFQRGLLVLECGVSSVRMSPALVVTEDQMKTALRIFAAAMADVAGDDHALLDAATEAGAMTGVEAAG